MSNWLSFRNVFFCFYRWIPSLVSLRNPWVDPCWGSPPTCLRHIFYASKIWTIFGDYYSKIIKRKVTQLRTAGTWFVGISRTEKTSNSFSHLKKLSLGNYSPLTNSHQTKKVANFEDVVIIPCAKVIPAAFCLKTWPSHQADNGPREGNTFVSFPGIIFRNIWR